VDELPLLELFTRLREAGMPLGIKDYELALRALQGGYGLSIQRATPAENRAALARLCSTLWVRSLDEQRLLNVYFDQLFGHEATLEPVSGHKATLEPVSGYKATLEPVSKLRNRILQGVSAFLFLIVIGTGTTLWLTHRNPLDLIRKISKSQPTPSPQKSSPDPAPSSPNVGLPQFSPQPIPQASEQGATTSVSPSLSPQPYSSSPPLPPTWIVWSLSMVVFSGVGGWGIWWFVRGWLKRESDQPTEPNSQPNLASELLRKTEDEIQLARAVRQLTTQEDRPRDRFVLSANYLPVTQRQMKQSWRHLRRTVREGLATELDMEATVRQIACEGILLELRLIPPRVNRTELVLLIDQDGSMVPFHSLSGRLAETAQRGGRLGKAGIYYFHNCPIDYLYTDRWHQQAESIPTVLARLRRDRTVILIFSDGGAARGGLNFRRVSLTIAFLRQLKQHVHYVAWVNPMPKTRWAGTTAGEIAPYVPMFEGTRQGLDQAIDILRGRHVLTSQPHEVTHNPTGEP